MDISYHGLIGLLTNYVITLNKMVIERVTRKFGHKTTNYDL